MIMAPGAADRHSQEGAADGVDLFVDDIEFQQVLVLVLVIVRPQHEETAGDQVLTSFLIALVGQEVAGDLFADKAVERLVVVESPDDIVTVAPCVFDGAGTASAGRVRIPGYVKPVPPPALSEMRRIKKLVNEGLIVFEGWVSREFSMTPDFGGSPMRSK